MGGQQKNSTWLKWYRSISLCLSLIFAIVGLFFLFMPDGVFLFFNSISKHIGYPESPLQSFGLFQVLAIGYMYLVTLLAYFMYKYPENTLLPLLLIHGKTASSVISFFLFFFQQPSLLFLVNGFVDGIIAIGVFFLYRKNSEARQGLYFSMFPKCM